jgi:hypothetical protein
MKDRLEAEFSSPFPFTHQPPQFLFIHTLSLNRTDIADIRPPTFQNSTPSRQRSARPTVIRSRLPRRMSQHKMLR